MPIRIFAFELKFSCFLFSSYYVAQSATMMDVLSCFIIYYFTGRLIPPPPPPPEIGKFQVYVMNLF